MNGGAELPVWTIRRLEPVANQGLQTRAQQGADTFPFAAQNYDFRRQNYIATKAKQKGIYFKGSDKERELIEQKMALAGIRNMGGYMQKHINSSKTGR